MTKWPQYRQILLAIAFVGVGFNLVQFSLDPTAGKRSLPPLSFPSVVPLPGWQLLENRPLTQTTTSPDKLSEVVLARQKYRYRGNNQQLEIEMRYIANTTGELQGYFQNYTSIPPQNVQLLQLRYQKETGFYSLFVYQERSHLSACINPHGASTVTKDQFLANRYKYDFQLWHLLPWLLGKSSLPDRRCLWADLSVAINQGSAEATYPILEQAWQSWYSWWSSRFP